MALAPKFAGQKFAETSTADTLHTIELFLDYVCPYSFKLFKTLFNNVFPVLKANNYKVQFIFRHQVQPWHPSSTLTHEAALAVLRLKPSNFWLFSNSLFEEQKSFFDVSVVNETRNETYKRLAKIGARNGVDERQMLDLLLVSDKPGPDGSLNIGNKVTDDLKVLVKMARLVGVHVSPTVIVDGVVDNSISSSWTSQEWMGLLDKLSKE